MCKNSHNSAPRKRLELRIGVFNMARSAESIHTIQEASEYGFPPWKPRSRNRSPNRVLQTKNSRNSAQGARAEVRMGAKRAGRRNKCMHATQEASE